MRTTLIIISLFMLGACGKTRETHVHGPASGKQMDSVMALMLSPSQVRLANITTKAATLRPVGNGTYVNGRLKTDDSKSVAISSRASGRIVKLHVKETGRYVEKGQPLYELYSEELITLQQEYLLALSQASVLGADRSESIIRAAANKLMLYGMSSGQVEQLADRNVADHQITFLAPASGWVTDALKGEGEYVREGDKLYDLINVKTLWLEAELYPGERMYAKPGIAMEYKINGVDTEMKATVVDFVVPAYKNNSQLFLVRATVPNPGSLYQPGMQALIKLSLHTHPGLTLPVDAVIQDGRGAHVYVETETNIFEPRKVVTGIETADEVEILSGLGEGEKVVVSGAYLLYSEFILRQGQDPSLWLSQHK